jgi:hypothetical protein
MKEVDDYLPRNVGLAEQLVGSRLRSLVRLLDEAPQDPPRLSTGGCR